MTRPRFCDTRHIFPSRAEFLALCDASGWLVQPPAEEGQSPPEPVVIPPAEVTLVDLGTIYSGGVFDEQGEVITPPVARLGWHVDIRWTGAVHEPWASAHRIYPRTPNHGFA